MIKVLIADDERHARERLASLLQRYADIEIKALAADGNELLTALKKQTFDAVFLDINMPGPPVFDTIAHLPKRPLIIFQTAYAQYAADAFGLEALDYLLKPVNRERLDQCINKIRNTRASKKKKQYVKQLSVRDDGMMKLIPVKDICSVSSEEGLSFICTQKEQYHCDKSLNSFETLLDLNKFFRISRETIINLDFAAALHPLCKGNWCLELKGGRKFSVSRRRMRDLKKKLAFL